MSETMILWDDLQNDVALQLLGVRGKPVLHLDSVGTHGMMLEKAYELGILKSKKSFDMLKKKMSPTKAELVREEEKKNISAVRDTLQDALIKSNILAKEASEASLTLSHGARFLVGFPPPPLSSSDDLDDTFGEDQSASGGDRDGTNNGGTSLAESGTARDDTIDTVVKQTSSDNVGVDMANPYPTNASLVSPPSVSNPAKRTPPSSLPGPPNLTAPSGHAAPTLPQVQDDIDGALFQLDENHAALLIAGETGGGWEKLYNEAKKQLTLLKRKNNEANKSP